MNNVKMLVADVTNILSIHEAVGQIISEQGRIICAVIFPNPEDAPVISMTCGCMFFQKVI